MSHIDSLREDDLSEFRPIFEGARMGLGFVPNSMLIMGHKPGILGLFSLLFSTIGHTFGKNTSPEQGNMMQYIFEQAASSDPDNEIPRKLQQMIAYVCSYSAGCRYCQAHTSETLHLMKLPDETIQALPKFDESELFSDAEKAALALAFAAGATPNRSTKAHFDELEKYYNDKQIVELVAVISIFGFLNRFNDTMATALEDPPHAFAENVLAPGGWDVGKHGSDSSGT